MVTDLDGRWRAIGCLRTRQASEEGLSRKRSLLRRPGNGMAVLEGLFPRREWPDGETVFKLYDPSASRIPDRRHLAASLRRQLDSRESRRRGPERAARAASNSVPRRGGHSGRKTSVAARKRLARPAGDREFRDGATADAMKAGEGSRARPDPLSRIGRQGRRPAASGGSVGTFAVDDSRKSSPTSSVITARSVRGCSRRATRWKRAWTWTFAAAPCATTR